MPSNAASDAADDSPDDPTPGIDDRNDEPADRTGTTAVRRGAIDHRDGSIRPLCRVFGGPTAHRVQFAGPGVRPAIGTDVDPTGRTPPEEESTVEEPPE